MNKRVRIKDVAEKAGVSTGTVDRVIHNRGNVAEDVRKRILQVMEELGFKRNLIASALAKNESYRVAVLIPDPSCDPFWVESHEGIKAAYNTLGHYGLLINYHFFELLNPADFHVQALQMLKTEPQAVIFPPLFTEEGLWLLNECKKRSIPCITFNTKIKNQKPLTYIGQDSYQSGIIAGRLLKAHLKDESTAIVLNLSFAAKNAPHLVQKKDGFEHYCQSHTDKNIEVMNYEFEEFDNPGLLREFMFSLKENHTNISGFFFTNSRAYHAIKAVENDQYFDDIAIVGFDLIKENIDYLFQDKINFLINQNPVEQGYLSVQSVFEYLILKKTLNPDVYLPLDIVVKENYQYYFKREKIRSSLTVSV